MSGSSKKQLRKEQNAAQLTEKQRKEQAEAKKLKVYSITFAAIIAVVLCVALVVMAFQGINRSGHFQKKTIALTVNEHQLSNVDLNYFYIDAINELYNSWNQQYGESAAYAMQLSLGLNANLPLNRQNVDDETTWAEYFIDLAIDDAISFYSVYDEATAAGYKLSEENQKTLEENIKAVDDYAFLYGYTSGDQQLSAMYGFGSDMESYGEYMTVRSVAQGYINEYGQSLSYTNDEIRDFEADKLSNYSSFNYASYYVPYSSFVTKDDSNEAAELRIEKALAKAKAAAETLLTATNYEELDAAIAAMEINAEKKDVASTKYTRKLGSAITDNSNGEILAWLTEEGRTEGDVTLIPSYNITADENGNETTTVLGYNVVMFESVDTNESHRLSNVRHILVKIIGGTTDEDGNVTYTDEQKNAAKAKADLLLESFLADNPTSESFAKLAKENTSDTASASTGGMIENIHLDSTLVPEFLEWSIDESRKSGDTGIVLTEYGYHIMYYDGDGEYNYRDYLISEDIRAEDVQVWYEEVLDSAAVVEGNCKYLNDELTISPNY